MYCGRPYANQYVVLPIIIELCSPMTLEGLLLQIWKLTLSEAMFGFEPNT